MTTEALRERLSNNLRLKTKTVGEDKIKKAKDNGDDVAIFSMVPLEGDTKFSCSLGRDCRIGDCKKATPGDLKKIKKSSTISKTINNRTKINLIIMKKRYVN